ncbi:MAG: HAMP domain-containing sensor histidine kinase [Slackia sp.]|nr:HAMP domain-containing sensor histidine kinase [Slackia sp.]
MAELNEESVPKDLSSSGLPESPDASMAWGMPDAAHEGFFRRAVERQGDAFEECADAPAPAPSDDADAQGRPAASRVRKACAWARHPVKSTRSFLDTCTVRAAFFFYAFVGMAVALAISTAATLLLAGVSENLLYGGNRVYPGLYIYDEEENALVKAEDMSWYNEAQAEFTNYADGSDPIVVEGLSLYVESYPSQADSRYRIPLDDTPEDVQGVIIHDMDERLSDDYRLHDTGIPLGELPAYDAAANAQRGDLSALAVQFPANSYGERPTVSLVGYYVYLPSVPAYQMLNLAVFVAVPVIFVVCFFAASRGFYKRKLQSPIEAMDEAARRIAEGDLAFSVPTPAAASRSELDRLCASFEMMRAHLERNNKAMWRVAENRRKVNAAFAHDLRTPLTVLKGRAEMLSTFAPEGVVDAEQVAEASRAMSRQTERLQRYVESMKDLADLDECAVEPREGDVGAWFVRAAAEAADLVRASDKEFEAKAGGLPRHAMFDDVALSRVVENALSNALRYARGKVGLSCRWEEGMLVVRVEDDGPGFDAMALEHGCEPFWRDGAEKRREDSAHFGLGLNICAELCEKHGGSVRLLNAEEGGAVVEACVAAPLARAVS